MVKVEACIRGDAAKETGLFARAVFQGGADTIELRVDAPRWFDPAQRKY